ncbi:T9SS type A sorting domain-containing protein [Flavobacterium phycosphaerae]|uniref:T9SS type A sorting domain-containing protein n=1 Tax=Flavobacterium phycosphaerae TaxID=2697515 RepID=UPI001389B479|nr:T9SS type A sorting domain-containing protein [Flavobacterium phycosphaerae]
MKTKLLLVLAIILTAFNVNGQNPTVVSITGEAVGGWGDGHDFDMVSSDGENWTITITVASANSPTPNAGGIKFRADHAWTVNWGSSAFPSGTGVQNGDNIQCIAGTYDVTFNSTTGEYNFSGGAPIPVVKLVGSAVTTPGGLVLSTLDLTNFTVSNATLVDGTAQFEVDGVLVGGLDFPVGTVTGETDLIPVTAGSYTTISVNIASGDYVFTPAPLFQLISLTGDAVGGWGDGHDFDLTPVDADNYRLNDIALIAADCKFRKDHDWATTWGSAAFPSGVSTGDNITVTTAGTYDAKLNIATGAYSFSFPLISLTGDAVGGWGDGHDFDLNTTDGVTYTLDNVVMTSAGCKFRRDHAWDTSWGGDGFPTGTPGNGDIIAVAGTYNITFSNLTKEYSFADVLSVNQFGKDSFALYPNPASNSFSVKGNFEKAEVYTISGQLVKTFVASESNQFSISDLSTGLYLVKVSDANSNSKTLKLIKE